MDEDGDRVELNDEVKSRPFFKPVDPPALKVVIAEMRSKIQADKVHNRTSDKEIRNRRYCLRCLEDCRALDDVKPRTVYIRRGNRREQLDAHMNKFHRNVTAHGLFKRTYIHEDVGKGLRARFRTRADLRKILSNYTLPVGMSLCVVCWESAKYDKTKSDKMILLARCEVPSDQWRDHLELEHGLKKVEVRGSSSAYPLHQLIKNLVCMCDDKCTPPPRCKQS